MSLLRLSTYLLSLRLQARPAQGSLSLFHGPTLGRGTRSDNPCANYIIQPYGRIDGIVLSAFVVAIELIIYRRWWKWRRL